MPYPRAHLYLLLLFPLTALAFWPGYFGNLRGAPLAFHVHGITASLWIALLAFQSWSIHRRQNVAHRYTGYASFALFPFFFVGGLLVVQSMALKFGAQSDPFFNVYGARLGSVDTLSTMAIGYLFFMGVRSRRKVHVHARYLLGTVFFLLMPIFSRLLTVVPPLTISTMDDLPLFAWCFHISNAGAILFTVALYLRNRKHGRPLLELTALLALQSVLFETLGRSAAWEMAFTAIGGIPSAAIASTGFAVAVGVVWVAWTSTPVRAPNPRAAA